MATFADRLKTLREARGETQQQIADLLGVHKQTISDYERCSRHPAGDRSLEIYEALADHFNVDLNYLLGRTDIVVRVLGEGSDPADADIAVELTPEELQLIKAYRRLDQYAKKLTRMAAHAEDE